MNTKFCFLLILLFSTFFSAFPQPMEVSQKLVRRNGVLYLIENNDSFAVSNSIITVKPKRVNDNIDNNLIVLRSNTLGFIDVKVPIDAEVEGYVESLRKTGKYETVEYNTIGKYHFIPNDNYISNQWYLNTINAYDSWDITCGNPEISVAIIDSGVDTNHSDLGFGSDGYTNLDIINGWNYELNNNTLITNNYHGTLVSGIVGAKGNNAIGTMGISGDILNYSINNVKLLSSDARFRNTGVFY